MAQQAAALVERQHMAQHPELRNVVTYRDQGGITGEKETKPGMDVGL